MKEYRGLIIKTDPLRKILYEGKLWELRGSPLDLEGNEKIKIALIESGTGRILGNCDIVETLGPLSKITLNLPENKKKHQAISIDEVFCRYKCKPYAWVIQNVNPFPEDKIIQFKYPKGVQTWVILENHDKRDFIFRYPED